MNKKNLIAAFVKNLENEMVLLKAAALATHDAATNEESKPENQYDTRALEAAYLAGAQAKRVNEIDEVLMSFHTINFKNFSPTDTVDMTALVTMNLDGKKNTLLVMPKGGGVNCLVENENIQIVTPQSRLGETIMGLAAGDVAQFEVGAHTRMCEILSVS